MAQAFVRARRWIGASIVAILLPATAALADPLAVLAAVKGKVEVIAARGKTPQRATFGRPLSKGDRVVVAAGSSATIFFNDGNVIELDAKSSITVGGKADARPASAGLPGEVYKQVSKFVTGGSRQTGLVAMSELRGDDPGAPFLVAPRRTALLEGRPGFSWRAVPGATRYRVTVSSAAQGELWSREVTQPKLNYPANAPGLVAGTEYLWEVDGRSAKGSLRRESSTFRVLAPEAARGVLDNLERIRNSAGGGGSAAARYLAGSYLFGLGLYQDASEQFGALCRLSPESPAPHEALGSVYTAVGLMDLAAAEFQQALALTREP